MSDFCYSRPMFDHAYPHSSAAVVCNRGIDAEVAHGTQQG